PRSRRTDLSSRTSFWTSSSFVMGGPHDELADLLVAAVRRHLDRALREPGLGGDLRDRPALGFEAADGLALLLRQDGEVPLHEQVLLRRQEREARVQERRRPRGLGDRLGARVLPALVAEDLVLAPAAPLGDEVEEAVLRDRVHPGAKRPLGIVGVAVAVDREQ